MDSDELRKLSVQELAGRLAGESNADIILYNGMIERPKDRELIAECIRRERRENVVLILVSPGGEADAAFRIARYLQR